MTPESILKDAQTQMNKAVDYLRSELKGIRTGRASTAIVEFIKVDYYGSMTDLKSLAALSVPEATQIVIQPFDPQSVGEIKKAIENANLGLNPSVDGKVIRVNIPPLSGDRRKQLIAQVKKMGEESKVACRNVRRDANKHIDTLAKDKSAAIPEDTIKSLKDDVQEVLKKHETEIDQAVASKTEDISHV